jgi:hypothetical protein
VSVEKDGEGIADDSLAMISNLGNLITDRTHAKTPCKARRPIPIGHLGPIGLEPVEVFDFRAVNRATLKKMAPAEDRLRFAQVNEVTHKSEQRGAVIG